MLGAAGRPGPLPTRIGSRREASRRDVNRSLSPKLGTAKIPGEILHLSLREQESPGPSEVERGQRKCLMVWVGLADSWAALALKEAES